MLPMDLPPSPDIQIPVAVLAQAASQVRRYDAVLGQCGFVEYGGEGGNWDFRSAINSITPLGTVGDYLKVPDDVPLSNVRVSVLTQPSHGTLRQRPVDHARGLIDNTGAYHYFPNNPAYRGKDRMTFEVEANGKRFKVDVTVFVVANVDRIPEKLEKRCPLYYRLSTMPDETNLAERLSDNLWSLASLDNMMAIESLASVASGISFVLDELPATTIAQTTGTGRTAQISKQGTDHSFYSTWLESSLATQHIVANDINATGPQCSAR